VWSGGMMAPIQRTPGEYLGLEAQMNDRLDEAREVPSKSWASALGGPLIVIAIVVLLCLGLLWLVQTFLLPADPLVGTWRQTGTVAEDGVVRSVPTSQAVVLELQRGGTATLVFGQTDAQGTAFTWEVARGLLRLGDHPGWDVRTVYELEYELEGDRLTANWIYGPPRRVFERR